MTMKMILRRCKLNSNGINLYKLDRRRRPLYTLTLLIVGLVFIFNSGGDLSSSKTNDTFDYIEPEPCVGDCPGENGQPVYLNAEESKDLDEIYKKEFFNLKASDKISLWRSIPDARTEECRSIKYPDDLPTASVIFIFKNERWSPVLRSVYSVINRSPRKYLKEVILVDDQSEIDEVKKPLDDYCKKHFGNIVKILRAPKRLGLIAAKNYGGRVATGDVVVFLDAHIEANAGWLEPILYRIQQKRSAILCPTIDNIDEKTMAYQKISGKSVGSFTWSLYYEWGSIPDRVLQTLKSATDPIPSPTMAGGLLAADRKYFFEIGGYDDDMEVWGGENLELSFRTWMCGGSLEFLPCSHVGHIFRPGHPYNMTGEKGKGDVHGRNSMRLAEVWMDEYKRLYYMYRKNLIGQDFGDISARVELRKRLNCHSFKWFLENVYPEKFVPDENVFAYGIVRNVESSYCLDKLGNTDSNDLGVFFCQVTSAGNQLFSYSKTFQMRHEGVCIFRLAADDEDVLEGSRVKLRKCDGSRGEKWKHTKESGLLIHEASGLCLDVTDVEASGFPLLRKCDQDKRGQKWMFETYIITS